MIKYLLLLGTMCFAMTSTPDIRPFDDSKLSKSYIYTNVIVGKYHEIRIDYYGKEHLHSGVDYALNKYTPILATAKGKIIFVEWCEGYGNCIVIEHEEGYTTLYAHIQKFAIIQEDIVTKAQVIGYVGATGNADGNHIHYELRKDGTPVFPGRFFK